MAKLRETLLSITEAIPQAIETFSKGVKAGREIGGPGGKMAETLSTLNFFKTLQGLQKERKFEAGLRASVREIEADPTRAREVFRRTALIDPARHAQAKGILLPKTVFTLAQVEKTIGDLEAKGSKDMFGITIEFTNREEALNHLYRELGRNWETILPKEKASEIREVLNRKFPEKGVKLPKPSIKKQYRIGQKITRGGTTYTYIGNGKWEF